MPLPPDLVRQVNDRTEQVAFVGDQAILAGDLLPAVDQALLKYEGKVPADQMQQQRAMYVQQMLARKIEVKLVLLDFMRSIPADKQKEVLANIDKQVEKQYYDEQVPETMKQLEVESLAALQAKLNKFGTSIEKQKSDFREQMLVRTMIGQKVEKIAGDHARPAAEVLPRTHQGVRRAGPRPVGTADRSVSTSSPIERRPTRPSSRWAIRCCAVPNSPPVAKKFSQEPNASDGGYHDWTNQGSLVSDGPGRGHLHAPLNRLSLKLEDERGFHIVRVIERTGRPAHRVRGSPGRDPDETPGRGPQEADPRLHRAGSAKSLRLDDLRPAGPDNRAARRQR